MRIGNFNKSVRTRNRSFPRTRSWLPQAIPLLALFGLLTGSKPAFGGETTLPESQVKSLLLLSLPRYVDWPSNAFTNASAPIVIGVLGEGKFGAELAKTVQGKTVAGRPILTRQIQTPEDPEECHILFIGSSEKSGLAEILSRLKARPVLTVGETDQFLEQGGVIRFAKKEGRIRLEVNLEAARQANLQISSRLLNVADVVKGKLK